MTNPHADAITVLAETTQLTAEDYQLVAAADSGISRRLRRLSDGRVDAVDIDLVVADAALALIGETPTGGLR